MRNASAFLTQQNDPGIRVYEVVLRPLAEANGAQRNGA